jgi:hypothetical protein
MKNVINYYYNLYPKDILLGKDYYYFFVNNIRYSFIKYLNNPQDVYNIYNMHLDILKEGSYIHPIILNKDQQILTFVDNVPYILLITTYYEGNITINNVIEFSNVRNNESSSSNWAELWSKKNDYLEYQINMLGQKHPIIRDSFSYYIGLSENAIEIVNSTPKTISKISFSHKRMSSTVFEFYNPLNLTTDLAVRDMAEYLKNQFFNGQNIEQDLTQYLSNKPLNSYEYVMFFARLLYPTYYFDMYEEIITNRKEDSEILKIIAKQQEYENIIKKIYHYFQSFLPMPYIEWLK